MTKVKTTLPENLLVDFYELQNISVLTDDKNPDISTFEGYAQEADKKNMNNRIYPSAVLRKALSKLQPKIKENSVFAYVNHPNFFEGKDLTKIGAIITDAQLVDGVIRIQGRFASTDAAENLKKLIHKDKARIGLSARGYGSVTYDEKQKASIIGDDYELGGWDFVSDAAVKKAMITAYENKNNNNIEEEGKMEIKNLTELKVAYPAFIAEALKPLEDAHAKLVVENSELSKKLADAKEENEKTSKELASLKESHEKLTAEVNKAKFDAEVAALLKDNKYSKYIVIPATMSSIEDAKSFIASETEKFDKLLAEQKEAKTDNKTVTPEKPSVPAKTEDAPKTKPEDAIMDEYIKLAIY